MDTPKHPRGRPRQPDALTPAERQRAYRARLAAAGRAVRVQRVIEDAFDSETQLIVERAFFEEQRHTLHNALLKIELLDEDRARLDRRNAYLEGELKRIEQRHTISLKEIVLLKQSLATKK
ncbi:hypothetical protein ACFSOZ_22920 [Mesorhizobium newzealandense]|uniref:Uncharacterized protein n=1 Tax=Mesorhizobium newzealandense TaxID=1300302 RepID=A0ABW4UCU8_9HYPH